MPKAQGNATKPRPRKIAAHTPSLTHPREAFLSGAAILLACSLLALVGSYVTRVLYARTFTPADYGLLYAVITWLAILGMIRNLGMGEALTYFVARNSDEPAVGKQALALTLSVQTILGIIIVAAAYLLGGWVSQTIIPDPRVPQLLVVFSVSYAIVGITEAIVAYYRGKQMMALVGASEPLRTLTVAAASIVAIGLQQSLLSVAYAWLVAYSLTAIVYGTLLLKNVAREKATNTAGDNKSLLSAMLRYAVPSFLAAAGLFVFYNVDTVIITALLGTYQTGLYNAAIPLANLLLLVTVPITIFLFPAISSLAQQSSRDALKQMHALATRVGLVAALCCAAPFLIFGPQLLGYFFGNAYSPAALALQILLIGGILRSLVEIEFATLAGLGAVKARAWLLGGALASNTALNILWVPRYGIAGAAVATTISFALLLVATLVYSAKAHSLLLPKQFFLKAIAASVPVIATGLYLAPRMDSVSFPVLLSFMCVTSLVTLGWTWLCGLVTKADTIAGAAFVRSILGKLRSPSGRQR